ncbi:MAG: four helix bundle protein [Acidobacteria bacterium]|nr:four helix bundle protein [Acidobacteriota bacterium]MBK8150093.1 four helix bundle protein [Acidobacteriota bacterium]MBK8811055.1 four helix bundle protein [Acidobacteriota bacterium]
MKTNILKEKSYKFALRTVRLGLMLQREKKVFILSRQIMRSGTSIGANIEESYQGESRADFIHKLSIANKEAFETNYWLRLLKDVELAETEVVESLLMGCDGLQRMLVASIKTAKSRA